MDTLDVNFLQDIISEQKRYFFKGDVKALANYNIPNYPELAFKVMWKRAESVPGFIDYFPDSWNSEQERVDKRFFWTILVTMNELYVLDLVKDVKRQRKERIKVKEVHK